MNDVVFTRPEWLLAGVIATALVVWLSMRRRRKRTRAVERIALALRITAITAVTLALAGLAFRSAGDGTTVLLVLDRSDSVPRSAGRRLVENLWSKSDRPGESDQIGLLVFGRNSGVERLPTNELQMPDLIETEIDETATDLASALRLAGATFLSAGATGGRRVVVVSDGNANIGDANLEARNLHQTGVVVDVCEVPFRHDAEILVEGVSAPGRVPIDEPYEIAVIVSAAQPSRVQLTVTETGDSVSDEPPWSTSRQVDLRRGKNRFTFERVSGRPDQRRYVARVDPTRSGVDGILENNVGYGFTIVGGARRTLFIGDPDEYAPFLSALESGEIDVEVRPPSAVPRNLDEYFAYDAIVVANVSAQELGFAAVERLHAVVDGLGVGFLMLGGPESFGAGGYKDTPIEELLPVDMEVKRKRILPSGALALILHTCEFEQGNQWAKQIAIRAVSALTPKDYFGVVQYDGFGGDRWGVPFRLADDVGRIQNQIRRLQPADMVSFETSMKLALTALTNASANQKHSIIISDGDPQPPSQQVMNGYQSQGISVSTVCIQPHNPSDTGRLKKIAADTGGRYYFADDPRKLPAIFFREALEVRRDMIREETLIPSVVADVEALRGLPEIPPIDGMIITTPKDLATIALATPGEFTDPVLAEWRFGLARTAAFTSDLTGRWSSKWVAWPGYDTFVLQLVRSIARGSQTDLFRVDTSVDGRRGRIGLDAIDPEGRYVDGLSIEGALVEPDLDTREIRFRQTGPGRYEADFDARDAGTSILSLDFEGDGIEGRYQSGVNVPYSAEYRELSSDPGALARLAAAGGGRVISPGDSLFSGELDVASDDAEIPTLLLVLALSAFLLDIIARRVRFRLSAFPLPAAFARKRGVGDTANVAAGTASSDSAASDQRVRIDPAAQKESDPSVEDSLSEATDLRPNRPTPKRPTPSASERDTDPSESTTSRLLDAKDRLRRRRGE